MVQSLLGLRHVCPLIQFCKPLAYFLYFQRLRKLTTPLESWGPSKPKDREMYLRSLEKDSLPAGGGTIVLSYKNGNETHLEQRKGLLVSNDTQSDVV